MSNNKKLKQCLKAVGNFFVAEQKVYNAAEYNALGWTAPVSASTVTRMFGNYEKMILGLKQTPPYSEQIAGILKAKPAVRPAVKKEK